MRWVGTRNIFSETTTSDKSWAVPLEQRRSQYVQYYSFPNIDWTVGKVWKLIPLKKGSLKVYTLKKFVIVLRTAKLFFSSALHVVQHSLYTSNLFPTPMQHKIEVHIENGTQWCSHTCYMCCDKKAYLLHICVTDTVVVYHHYRRWRLITRMKVSYSDDEDM